MSFFMEPEKLKDFLTKRTPRPEGEYRPSSVLALLVQKEKKFHLLFSKRAQTLKHQPGDVCFPGGKIEKGETPLECALRETYEEIGIFKDDITILGKGDFFITPFGAYITPFIGLIQETVLKKISFNIDEVEEVFTVPLDFFLDTEPLFSYIYLEHKIPDDFPFALIVGGRDYKWSKTKYKELFYQYEGKVIWGMTARMTYNICQILREIKESF